MPTYRNVSTGREIDSDAPRFERSDRWERIGGRKPAPRKRKPAETDEPDLSGLDEFKPNGGGDG